MWLRFREVVGEERSKCVVLVEDVGEHVALRSVLHHLRDAHPSAGAGFVARSRVPVSES